MTEIPLTIHSDENGYFDRECPNENCLYRFKIKLEDWQDKVSDEEVHCPMCGHIDTSDKWWTQEQLSQIQEIVGSYFMSYAQKELDKAWKKVAQSTRHNKYMKITYKPGKRIDFINNPIGQSEEWAQEITCEKCGTRYSVIGSAYFCPCCGYNSATSAFDESLDSITKMMASLPQMEKLFAESYGEDKANTMCRSMLEGTLGDCVSAFQKFAQCRYSEITGKDARVNDFQIVGKGSDLFKSATGKGYDEWLSSEEITELALFFQRRHLFEHNNGMVDQQYLDKTGDKEYALGQRIVARVSDTNRLIILLKKLGKGILSLEVSPIS